ncbi:uncharacterized protein [Nicotiana tomentosiformis]|uniref:uncharacterized protein n=1 Tax=Nicotiana tomentosiformis TaxID=4098 RepID=UPI00388C8586
MDGPRFRRGAPPQISQALRALLFPQAMITAPATTPPTQPSRGGGHARYYALPTRTEAVVSNSVITYTVPICHKDASVLFDPGSTYSYVSSYFASYLCVSRDSLSSPVHVSTPVGDSIIFDCVYRSCLIVLSGCETRADLLLLGIADFNVILGMYWLSPYHAILVCHSKTVTLAMPGLP